LEVGGERPHYAAAKAMDVLAMVGLAHKSRALPLELSSGEQQRVAIARAMVGNAAVILADEPTAALDGENGHSVMSLLAQFAKSQSRGVLVVTHDARTLPFANRIVRINDGRIVGEEQGADASPAEQT
jgi:putative ABC transport system ATP-binding protein